MGVQSDRIWTERWGRRRPFMIFAAPFMAASLILIPFQPGLVPIAVSTFVFFAAYHFYSSPYQSLLPDVTPAGFHGRVQGYQSVMRGGGMFLGMLAATFLFGLWKPLPFVICGVLIMVVTYVTVVEGRTNPTCGRRARRSSVSCGARWRASGARTWSEQAHPPLHGGGLLVGGHACGPEALHTSATSPIRSGLASTMSGLLFVTWVWCIWSPAC